MMNESLRTPELKQLLGGASEPAVRLLDVRTVEEYVYNGHLPGATLIPLDELIERAHEELSPDQPVVTICEHGVRSAHAAAALAQLGFRAVYNYADGMESWDGPRDYAYPSNRPLNRTIADGLALTPA